MNALDLTDSIVQVFFGPGETADPDIKITRADYGIKPGTKAVDLRWEKWRAIIEGGVKELARDRYDAAVRKLARRARQKLAMARGAKEEAIQTDAGEAIQESTGEAAREPAQQSQQ